MLTKNFYAAMMVLLGKTQSAALNKNGENISLGFPTNDSNNYGIFPYMFQYDKENAYQYVEFGKGTTPATTGDYKLDNKITASRPLDIFIFNVQKSEDIHFETHYESLLYFFQICLANFAEY